MRKHREKQQKMKEVEPSEHSHIESEKEKAIDFDLSPPDRLVFLKENEADSAVSDDVETEKVSGEHTSEVDGYDTGGTCVSHMLHTLAHGIALLAWIPGQGVQLDYAATIEILIQQLDNQRMLFKFERCVSC